MCKNHLKYILFFYRAVPVVSIRTMSGTSSHAQLVPLFLEIVLPFRNAEICTEIENTVGGLV